MKATIPKWLDAAKRYFGLAPLESGKAAGFPMKHVRFDPASGRHETQEIAPCLLTLNNPFTERTGSLMLLEPVDTPIEWLRLKVMNGSYPKPFILEEGRRRSLHFDLAYVQSVMSMDDPWNLELRYTRKMMGFLLFCPTPGRILFIGLGGGSLVKYCYRYLPASRLVAVEIDPYVMAFRPHFDIPADDERLLTWHGDGNDYLRNVGERHEVILVDAYTSRGISSSITETSFLEQAKRRLTADGVLVINLGGKPETFQSLVDDAGVLFPDATLVVPVGDDGNSILFGFNAKVDRPGPQKLIERARLLSRRHALDLNAIAQAMNHAALSG